MVSNVLLLKKYFASEDWVEEGDGSLPPGRDPLGQGFVPEPRICARGGYALHHHAVAQSKCGVIRKDELFLLFIYLFGDNLLPSFRDRRAIMPRKDECEERRRRRRRKGSRHGG